MSLPFKLAFYVLMGHYESTHSLTPLYYV